MDNICAGIVTYNPDLDRLLENINAVLSQVSKVFIADNGSENVELISQIKDKYNNQIVLIKNVQNEGIAYALNQLIEGAKNSNYEWILTLDQDSVIQDGLIDEYRKYLHLPQIGIFSCRIKDRNFTEDKTIWNENYREVDKCITSGALTSVSACIESGGFDNELFIDSVDYDICYSLKEHGYRTICIDYCGLLHEVGKSDEFHIGPFRFAVNNHPAWRKYYISRNSVYMIKKHKLNPIIEYFYVYRRIFTVLFFEKDKKNKVSSIIRGIRDGKKMGKRIRRK